MTYRSDHEAALARVAALESENGRLAAELANRATPRRLHEGLPVLGLLAVAGLCFAIPLAMTRDVEPSASATVNLSLEACERALAPLLTRAEFESDPRAARLWPARHLRTGCRDEVRTQLMSLDLSTNERSTLERWLAAEDKHATARSLLETYYSTNATSEVGPLWQDFEHTYEDRQFAIEAWRVAR